VADENTLYGYDDHRLTHQPRVIFDSNNNRHTQLAWDANGNLSTLWMCEDKFARFHDWDDENRLRLVVGNEQAGFYGYDANGDRVYKLTGRSEITNIGPELSDAFVRFDNAVLYPNPYVTITPKEYTKHYYANRERLATSIGQGGWCFTSPDVISNPQTEHEVVVRKLWHDIYSGQYPFEYPHEPMPEMTKNVDIADNPREELQYRCPIRRLQRLKIDYEPNILLASMQSYCWSEEPEIDIFYSHSDHLGSANWITNDGGKPVQYLHYLPYGQLLANQTPYGYDERYKFTGKERDAETGYDFFGARYYWSLLKHWTKVDPLVDNYLHISPYAYCNWNPIKYVDPDGQWAQIVIGAAVSAAADAAIQVGASMYNGNSFGQAVRNIDMRSVAGSAVAGAIGVGVVSKVSQAAKIYKLGKTGTSLAKTMAAPIGDAMGSVVSQEIATGNISSAQVFCR
jgi:RHS repeat-associated protein